SLCGTCTRSPAASSTRSPRSAMSASTIPRPRMLRAGDWKKRSMRVSLTAVTRAPRVDRTALARSAKTILGALGSTDAEPSLAVVADGGIARLAGDYGRRRRATDVLAFAQREGAGRGMDRVLGDVVISLDAARRQAARRGVTLEHELRALLIHGCLHLHG